MLRRYSAASSVQLKYKKKISQLPALRLMEKLERYFDPTHILTTSNIYTCFGLVSLPLLISGNVSSTNWGTADQYQRQIQPAWLVSLSWHYAECFRYLQPPNPPTKYNHKTSQNVPWMPESFFFVAKQRLWAKNPRSRSWLSRSRRRFRRFQAQLRCKRLLTDPTLVSCWRALTTK